MRSLMKPTYGLLLSLGLLLAVPAPEVEAQAPDGFLFGRPKVTLSFLMGYGVPSAGSDVFREAQSLFTLRDRDFHAPVLGGALAVHLTDRVDLALDVAYLGSDAWSEYRDWEEELEGGERIPIEQETRFTRVPVTMSLRYFLLDRGREVSRFAWVPTRWAPYLGAGFGTVWYQFEQEGDFVDFEDESIFRSRNTSDGSAWAGHILAGAQLSLSPRFVLTVEGRYLWADAELDRRHFSNGYDPIDLAGFQSTLGIGVRF